MNRTSIVLLLASVLLVTGSLVGCGTPSENETFPNENLESAIRDALSKPLGEEITPADLAGLTNLTELNLSGN